jgi:hypothetical protein
MAGSSAILCHVIAREVGPLNFHQFRQVFSPRIMILSSPIANATEFDLI